MRRLDLTTPAEDAMLSPRALPHLRPPLHLSRRLHTLAAAAPPRSESKTAANNVRAPTPQSPSLPPSASIGLGGSGRGGIGSGNMAGAGAGARIPEVAELNPRQVSRRHGAGGAESAQRGKD